MASTTISSSEWSAPIDHLPPEQAVFGSTEMMRSVQQKAEKVASANVPVLILGESGTGKELVARYIHRRSPWQAGPFVKVNCPAIPGTLIESEMFGYEKGAFTGAYGSKPGRVELAHRGTLFLDEIAELDAALQAKFLQLLQDGQFCRIGGQEDTHVEVRVICATHRNLEQEIEAGSFRQDLFFRINVIKLELAPLRQRTRDIPDLAAYLQGYWQKKFNREVRPISAQLLRLFQEYDWPGNIRELENLVKRYVILGSEEAISGELLGRTEEEFKPTLASTEPISLKKMTKKVIRDLERKVIFKTLQATNWNRRKAAKTLDISYRALLYKSRQAGLPSKRTRREPDTEPIVPLSPAAPSD